MWSLEGIQDKEGFETVAVNLSHISAVRQDLCICRDNTLCSGARTRRWQRSQRRHDFLYELYSDLVYNIFKKPLKYSLCNSIPGLCQSIVM